MSDIDKAVFAVVRAIRRAAGGAATVAALQFSSPVVTVQADGIAVSGELRGAVSDKATRVVATGTPVTIRYEGVITDQTSGSSASWRASCVRVLRYDALKNVFIIEADGTTTQHPSPAGAVAAFSSYRLAFQGVDLRSALDYKVEAFISYPSDRGETSQALWGYVTPYVRVRDFHLLLRSPHP